MNNFSLLKRNVKKTLNSFGLEVHRFNPHASKVARLTKALDAFGIELVLDVGANEGQFAQEIRAGGYSRKIVSIEPMSSAFQKLIDNSRGDVGWQVHPRCALGGSMGEIELNIAGNSVSSSVLPMLPAHSDAAPTSAYQGKEVVPLTTLDLIAPPYLERANAPFLKIDTQGYEWHVLDGATKILGQVRGIQMELSLVPLYEGQRLWRESIDRLEELGLTLWAVEPVFVDESSGRTLQVDALFFRL
jgi:FkbM family methyltransferase